MEIEIKGRNITITDEMREHVAKRFEKVSKQVSPLARLEVEFSHERNPAIAESHRAEATLYLKGITLRAADSAREPLHALKLCSEEIARQVKRHMEKRRHRRDARVEPATGESASAA
jgi:putative sigma-54 modulation protein